MSISLVEGGPNLSDGKNGGNYISDSDMPTNNVYLEDNIVETFLAGQ